MKELMSTIELNILLSEIVFLSVFIMINIKINFKKFSKIEKIVIIKVQDRTTLKVC